MGTVSFAFPSDRQAQYEKFKRTVFLLNKSQGEALAEALEDFNIKHSIMAAPETYAQIDKPKTCVELLLETEPNELRKFIVEINSGPELNRLNGHGRTILRESEKALMNVYFIERGVQPVKAPRTPENRPRNVGKDHQKIDESQYLMPVLQGDCESEGEE